MQEVKDFFFIVEMNNTFVIRGIDGDIYMVISMVVDTCLFLFQSRIHTFVLLNVTL